LFPGRFKAFDVQLDDVEISTDDVRLRLPKQAHRRPRTKEAGMQEFHRAGLATALAASLLVAGCALPSRDPALSVTESRQTNVLDIPNARFMPPDASAVSGLSREFVAAAERYKATRQRAGLTGPLPPVAYLAISGGGDDGAYGAGLLVGWTGRGDRPEFRAVTGVSTGALSAFRGTMADVSRPPSSSLAAVSINRPFAKAELLGEPAHRLA
jgi:hypothetical protein